MSGSCSQLPRKGAYYNALITESDSGQWHELSGFSFPKQTRLFEADTFAEAQFLFSYVFYLMAQGITRALG